jgi:hypothetical protein
MSSSFTQIAPMTESMAAPTAGKIITEASRLCVVAAIVLAICWNGPGAFAQTPTTSRSQTTAKEERMKMLRAKGTFEVKVNPQKADNREAETAQVGRMSLDKKFSGELDAVSTGEMLFAGTEVEGSGGYVAIERVTGTLNGKHGSFVFQQLGTMKQNVPQMSVTVLPDSGTGELVGITGTMTITIVEGKHFYEFAYALP